MSTGIICGCASDECRVLGCARVREIRQRASLPVTPMPLPFFPPTKQGPAPKPRDGQTVVVQPLTEADVRRIIREEIAAALTQHTGSDA